MRIINVITFRTGILVELKSFVIKDTPEHHNPQIELAEQVFEETIKKIDPEIDDDDIYVAKDNGSWDDINGNQIMITWSNEVI